MSATATVSNYFAALAAGDMDALSALLADDVVWRQPGEGSLSGVYEGKSAVFALLGAFMERSRGSFRIDEVGPLMANGDVVSVRLHFAAEADGRSMAMGGVDVLRVVDGRIQDVWLFSEDQAAEDAFWG